MAGTTDSVLIREVSLIWSVLNREAPLYIPLVGVPSSPAVKCHMTCHHHSPLHTETHAHGMSQVCANCVRNATHETFPSSRIFPASSHPPPLQINPEKSWEDVQRWSLSLPPTPPQLAVVTYPNNQNIHECHNALTDSTAHTYRVCRHTGMDSAKSVTHICTATAHSPANRAARTHLHTNTLPSTPAFQLRLPCLNDMVLSHDSHMTLT